MSTENKAPSFTVKVTNPQTGNTNEVRIKQFIPTKGRGQGNPKLIPENLSQMSIQDMCNIWGDEIVRKVLALPRLKQLLSAFTEEATTKQDGSPETDSKVIEAEYSDMFGKLSLRGETLTEIKSRIDEIQEVELMDALNAGNIELAMALKDELISLRKDYDSKKVRRAKTEEAPAPAPTAPVTA